MRLNQDSVKIIVEFPSFPTDSSQFDGSQIMIGMDDFLAASEFGKCPLFGRDKTLAKPPFTLPVAQLSRYQTTCIGLKAGTGVSI
jgi:hypothetical protein